MKKIPPRHGFAPPEVSPPFQPQVTFRAISFSLASVRSLWWERDIPLGQAKYDLKPEAIRETLDVSAQRLSTFLRIANCLWRYRQCPLTT